MDFRHFPTRRTSNENQSLRAPTTSLCTPSLLSFSSERHAGEVGIAAADSDEGFLSKSREGCIRTFTKWRVPGIHAALGDPPQYLCRENRNRPGDSRDQRKGARYFQLRME